MNEYVIVRDPHTDEYVLKECDPDEKSMMACGHVSNSHSIEEYKGEKIRIRACVICTGIQYDENGKDMGRYTMPKPSLEGRMAKCSCGNKRPSDWSLPFFEYKGPGSNAEKTHCKNCGMTVAWHKPDHWFRVKYPEKTRCEKFEPGYEYEHDEYYCGCSGWN